MSITIKCPGCGKAYQLKDNLAGKRVKCKCGQPIVIPPPVAAAESEDSTYGLAGSADLDHRPSLVEEESASRGAGPPVGPQAGGGAAPPPAAEEHFDEPRRPARKRFPAPLMKSLAIAGCLVGLAVGAVVGYLAVASVLKPGFRTPEEAFRAYQEALSKKDWKTQIRVLDRESQAKVVEFAALMTVSIAEPGPAVREVFRKHGVAIPAAGKAAERVVDDVSDTEEEGESSRSQAPPQRPPLAAAVQDKPAFYAELMAALEAEEEKHLPQNPVLKLMAKKAKKEAMKLIATAKLTNVRIESDTAQATMVFAADDEEVETPVLFKRFGGRWFLHMSKPEDFGGSGAGSLLDGIPML
ncbi:MAG: hypothetical protein HUU20_04960 [Pirellulales bacterium]|nr:hypothetical protein [Pirellulales bacterium]